MPSKPGEIERALKRPANYGRLSPDAQWDVDRRLGILDWDPTPEEAKEFTRRWNELHGKKTKKKGA